MKRRFIAYVLLILCAMTAFVQQWDINRRVESCLDEINEIDFLVKNKEYEKALNICEKIDEEFTESVSNTMFCYYRHDDLQLINTKLAVMEEYIRQNDFINYSATSIETVKMLTNLRNREQINIKNIM